MRRIHVLGLIVCLLAGLLLPVTGLAETVYATLKTDVQVSTGPGDQYGQLRNIELDEGERVLVRTKHNNDKETWLQVAFTRAGQGIRGYVRYADVKADIRRVPAEAPLCTGKILDADAVTAAGPWGCMTYGSSLRAGTSGIIYEVEDGCAHIEYWNYAEGEKWRSWIALTDLATDMYFGVWGYYGVAEEDSLFVPEPAKAPSTYYGDTKGYPVGKMFTVLSGSCHVKRGAGTDYETVNYAYVGERYEVLECRAGSTGKDWYKIKINGAYGWISSGLVSLD